MDEYRALAREFLRDMVGIDTSNPPGGEAALASYIAGRMTAYGFRAEQQTLSPGRANLVLRLGQAETRILLTGHLDTVPAGDGWQYPPFAATAGANRIYGRGTADMKGGLAAMMAAAARLSAGLLPADRELVLAFAADEEQAGAGTSYFAAHYEKRARDLVVIGEPTGLDIHIAHRGVTRFRVTINGRQCHSGTPERGINAIMHMARFVLALGQYHDSLQGIRNGILPPPSVTATLISGGVKDNVVPGVCAATLDCRTVPELTPEIIRASLLGICSDLFSGTAVTYAVDLIHNNSPAAVSENCQAAIVAKKTARAVFGREASVSFFPACCDMAHFLEHGFSDVILCGPGSIEQAHTGDEFIETEQLDRAVDWFTRFVLLS